MAHAARLRKMGGSVMLAIPKPVLEALDLGPDVPVDLSIRSGKLVVERKRRRYSLHELLAEHNRIKNRLPVDLGRDSDKAMGRELV